MMSIQSNKGVHERAAGEKNEKFSDPTTFFLWLCRAAVESNRIEPGQGSIRTNQILVQNSSIRTNQVRIRKYRTYSTDFEKEGTRPKMEGTKPDLAVT